MKKKQRIFIAAHYLEIGGAEISLIGLLQSIDYALYDVDLFLYRHTGELMSFIPNEVNLIAENPTYTQFECSLKQTLFSQFWRIGVARLKTKWQYRKQTKKREKFDGNAYFQLLADNITPLLPSLDYLGEYDLAINFIGLLNIVRDKVRAKKKIAWIHTDYSQISVFPELEYSAWSSYDYIASVSEGVTKSFLSVFPSLEDKVIEIENILSSVFVRSRAEEIPFEIIDIEMQTHPDEINLLTIGRYSYAKKLEEIPTICRGILDAGVSVKWFIIGYGGSDEYIRKEIDRHRVGENVIILGKKENPYPYIKACDWYIQPSRYEGKSVVVREAQILGKPVIVTNYPTASSQIKHNVDGVIVPMEINECVDQMVNALSDSVLKEKILKYVSYNDYGNISEVEKLYAILENE